MESLKALTEKPGFMQLAFIVAIILFILAHKFTVEAMIE
jgi:hypothetical protein